jgi:hypothetical protein
VWADAHGGQLVQVHQAADECDRDHGGPFRSHGARGVPGGIQENIGDGLVMRIKDHKRPGSDSSAGNEAVGGTGQS